MEPDAAGRWQQLVHAVEDERVGMHVQMKRPPKRCTNVTAPQREAPTP